MNAHQLGGIAFLIIAVSAAIEVVHIIIKRRPP